MGPCVFVFLVAISHSSGRWHAVLSRLCGAVSQLTLKLCMQVQILQTVSIVLLDSGAQEDPPTKCHALCLLVTTALPVPPLMMVCCALLAIFAQARMQTSSSALQPPDSLAQQVHLTL
jgi:hypothetical protein